MANKEELSAEANAVWERIRARHAARQCASQDEPDHKMQVGRLLPGAVPYNQELVDWSRDESLSEQERGEASRVLIRRIWSHLTAIAASRLPSASHEELEDIVSEVYVRLLSSNRLTFLTRNLLALIVQNTIVDRQRRAGSRLSYQSFADSSQIEELLQRETPTVPQSDSLLHQVYLSQIKELLRNPEFEIIWLRNCEERSFEEIGKYFKVSPATARQRHRRTVLRLREQLSEEC